MAQLVLREKEAKEEQLKEQRVERERELEAEH